MEAWLDKVMVEHTCPDCKGARIRATRLLFTVGGIAIAMFIALVGWGGRYFGWEDPDGKVQLALVTTFILGIIGGYKSRGS